MKYDKEGRELPDDTPVEVPLRFRQVAGNGDILQGMLQRLREEQEKEVAETSGEFFGEEVEEFFDLPTRYELDHDAEERSLLFAENAARIKARRRAENSEDRDETGDNGARQAGDRDRARRDGGESRSPRRKANRVADREGGAGEDDRGGEDGEGEG